MATPEKFRTLTNVSGQHILCRKDRYITLRIILTRFKERVLKTEH